jgi:uncharacterized protein (DUF1778 family)
VVRQKLSGSGIGDIMKAKPDYKRYSLRWPAELHVLAEKAATIKGHESLKSYLIELVEKDARKTLEDYTTINLSNEDFDRFTSYFSSRLAPDIPVKFMTNENGKE